MKITKTETKEMDVTLPFFFKSGTDCCAIYNEREMLVVTYREYTSQPPSIWIVSRSVDVPANYEEITAKEFEQIFDKANDYISAQYEVMRDMIETRKGVYAQISGGEE